MSTGIVTLSDEGFLIARMLSEGLLDAVVYVHQSVPMPTPYAGAERFERILELTERIFSLHRGLIYIAPAGAVVRALVPCIRDKHSDPAVVVVDVGGRFAVSLLSGHEGGANRLATKVASIIGAEPVISTTTEAKKTLVVGIGCRRGVAAGDIVGAVGSVLEANALPLGEVRLLATADIKKNETGLIEAADALHLPLVFVSSTRIRTFEDAFEKSEAAARNVDLPAVAEPACMLAGRNTELLVRKTICNHITIAIAKEHCPWSESVRGIQRTEPFAPMQ